MLNTLKFRLSHISSDSWSWRLVRWAFGDSVAEGKACTFYWFKLPGAVLWLVIVSLYEVVLHWAVRAFWKFLAWFFGYQFKGKVFDYSIKLLGSRNYRDYKEQADGNYKETAPWQIAFGLFAFYLIFVNPSAGLRTLGLIAFIAAILIVVWFSDGGYKSPAIKNAKRQVKNAWDKVCPPLVVQHPLPEGHLHLVYGRTRKAIPHPGRTTLDEFLSGIKTGQISGLTQMSEEVFQGLSVEVDGQLVARTTNLPENAKGVKLVRN